MSDTRTKEQIEADWWAAWWKEDYTWDGLAEKPLKGWVVAGALLREIDSGRIYGQAVPETPVPVFGTPASIQDFWRADPATGRLRGDAALGDELVSAPDQPVFHRIHLPLAYLDKAPTKKVDWTDDALDALIGPRLLAANETVWDGTTSSRTFKGPDGRVQLVGAVLLSGFAHPRSNRIPLSIECTRAAFTRTARFFLAIFSGDTLFDSATFSGDASFDGATFSSNASFNLACFLRKASFHSAIFSGDACFDRTTFSGDARFRWATFSRYASFDRAAFVDDVSFVSANFSGYASFQFAWFGRAASFVASADKPAVTFVGPVDFSNAIFEGAAQFDGAAFKARINFETAMFRRFADFARVQLPEVEADWRGGFDGALFEATLDARGIDAKGVSLFEGARFDRGVMLERIDEKMERQAHKDALNLACRAADREVALRALESGALKLKQAMEAEKDYAREQRFHRLELRAKRKLKATSPTEKAFSGAYLVFARYGGSIGVPAIWLLGVIAVFASVYWSLEQGTGRVRESLSRVSIDRSFDPNLVEAARYSLSRVFPLGTWDDSDEPVRVVVDEAKRSGAPFDVQADCSFRERLVAAGGCRPAAVDFTMQGADGAPIEDRSRLEVHRTFIAMLSTLQTVFAGALYFVLGLAVRRKFQIS